MPDLTIGRAAHEAGVGVETIRFYERRGLIEQPKKPFDSGFRVYSPEQVKRVRFIRQAQQIGFSLHEIEELLALRADPTADCSEVREEAVAKLAEVRRKIAQLEDIGAALQALIAVCPGQGAVEACSILDTLGDQSRTPAAPDANGAALPGAPPNRRPAKFNPVTQSRRAR